MTVPDHEGIIVFGSLRGADQVPVAYVERFDGSDGKDSLSKPCIQLFKYRIPDTGGNAADYAFRFRTDGVARAPA